MFVSMDEMFLVLLDLVDAKTKSDGSSAAMNVRHSASFHRSGLNPSFFLPTMSPEFGPSHTQINLDPAPHGNNPARTARPGLPQTEHKQPRTGFNIITAHQPGLAWFQRHGEQGTHVSVYPSHLGRQVMVGSSGLDCSHEEQGQD